MNVIGVAGQLGNGKDEFADYLAESLNKFHYHDKESAIFEPLWRRSAFANAVKKVYMDAFGVDMDFIEKWKRIDEAPPGKIKNVRKSLQFIGDGFRQIQDDIWIEIALRDESKSWILSDSRYINEAIAVKAKGGLMFVLWRPGWENDDPNPSESQILPVVQACLRTQKEGPIDHMACAEEPNLQYFDFFLKNDGSLTDLYQKIDDLVVPYVREYPFGGHR
jgi:hypothetical protein